MGHVETTAPAEAGDTLHPALSDERAVVAVFDDRMAAEYAVDALEQIGFTHRHIGFVIRGADVAAGGMLSSADGAKDIRGAAAGIITGGIVGGVLATAAAVLIPPVGVAIAAGLLSSFFGGTVAGMAVGGMLGAMKGLGVSEEESRFYEKQFHEGKAIVAVQAGNRAKEAADILARHGGMHITAKRIARFRRAACFIRPELEIQFTTGAAS